MSRKSKRKLDWFNNNSRYEKLNYIARSENERGYIRSHSAIKRSYKGRDETVEDISNTGSEDIDGDLSIKKCMVKLRKGNDIVIHEHIVGLTRFNDTGPYGDKAYVYRKKDIF